MEQNHQGRRAYFLAVGKAHGRVLGGITPRQRLAMAA